MLHALPALQDNYIYNFLLQIELPYTKLNQNSYIPYILLWYRCICCFGTGVYTALVQVYMLLWYRCICCFGTGVYIALVQVYILLWYRCIYCLNIKISCCSPVQSLQFCDWFRKYKFDFMFNGNMRSQRFKPVHFSSSLESS